MRKIPIEDLIKKCSRLLPDKAYLKIKYKYSFGKKLDLEHPTTFNEKLQWLKLYDRRHEYINLVDKYTVREYIKRTIGNEYLIPLLHVYENVNAIDWSKLPNQFVLKCTHGSGSNIICNDKSKLDVEIAKKHLDKWMKKNWYWYGREWPYKHVKPRIICEKYMVDESETELKDYKFFCFNGTPRLIQVDFNRYADHKRNLYDIDWNFIDATIKYPNKPDIEMKKPEKLYEMRVLATRLARNYPHVRVDFYLVYGKIYFGELTFYHGSGFEKFEPKLIEEQLGSWIRLPYEIVK